MPDREAVQLGNRTIELEPQDAATVRDAFLSLSQAYGQSLDEQRRNLLSQMGTPQWQAPAGPVGPEPVANLVPDTDLLFADKTTWAHALTNNVERRLAERDAHQVALVQGAMTAVQQELQRRDLAARAQTVHDTAMEDMIARHNLDDNRGIVQMVYNDQFQHVQHLPIAMAFDQIGQLAEQEIARIRGGAAATPAAQYAPPPLAPAEGTSPPAMLRSARRAGGAEVGPAPGGPKTLTDLIHARQAAFFGRAA
jgi:hypothetical protein